MLCIYSVTANLTIAYNLGAIGGMMLALQIASGILVAMTYVASDAHSFTALDTWNQVPGTGLRTSSVRCYRSGTPSATPSLVFVIVPLPSCAIAPCRYEDPVVYLRPFHGCTPHGLLRPWTLSIMSRSGVYARELAPRATTPPDCISMECPDTYWLSNTTNAP